jgi:thymidylate synthase (FAD)
MKILKPKYEILTEISEKGKAELQHIEQIARVCYKSEDKITEGSAERLVKQLIKNGHEAMLEHSTLAVKFTVDRGVTHELVRHRIASFAQSSTRYCNYSRDKFNSEINVIDLQGGIERDIKCNKLSNSTIDAILLEWHKAIAQAEESYLKMIELGATPQIARSVLPNSTMSEIVITANYREWRNIFKLRADTPAHPQMREVMIPLLRELQFTLPIIFDDILPIIS